MNQSSSSLVVPLKRQFLISWVVLEFDMDMEELKQNFTILHVEAFNSEKKRSAVSMSKADSTNHVNWKGAAEMILF